MGTAVGQGRDRDHRGPDPPIVREDEDLHPNHAVAHDLDLETGRPDEDMKTNVRGAGPVVMTGPGERSHEAPKENVHDTPLLQMLDHAEPVVLITAAPSVKENGHDIHPPQMLVLGERGVLIIDKKPDGEHPAR